MTDDQPQILIFYSSKTEPELLTFYADGLAYLREKDIQLDVIDVSENRERAQQYDVKTTPTVLIEKDEEVKKRYEVVSYLSGILEKENLEEILEE